MFLGEQSFQCCEETSESGMEMVRAILVVETISPFLGSPFQLGVWISSFQSLNIFYLLQTKSLCGYICFRNDVCLLFCLLFLVCHKCSSDQTRGPILMKFVSEAFWTCFGTFKNFLVNSKLVCSYKRNKYKVTIFSQSDITILECKPLRTHTKIINRYFSKKSGS